MGKRDFKMTISDLTLIVLAVHLFVFILLPIIRRSAAFSRWYDRRIGSRIPRPFKNGAAWGRHLVISILVATYAALWGILLPEGMVIGARTGAAVALIFYSVREARIWRDHAKNKDPGKWDFPKGWGFGRIMNVIGPVLINIWTWML